MKLFREALRRTVDAPVAVRRTASRRPTRPGWLTWLIWAALLASTVWVYIAARGQPNPGKWIAAAWVFTATTIFLTAFLAGWQGKRTPYGTWINDRNLVSLSKAQFWTWLCLLLATALTATIFGEFRPTGVDVVADLELLGVLGLSAGGLAGATAIAAGKAAKEVNPRRLKPHAQRLADRHVKEYLAEAIDQSPKEIDALVSDAPGTLAIGMAAARKQVLGRGEGKSRQTLQAIGAVRGQLKKSDHTKLAEGLRRVAQGSPPEQAARAAGLKAGLLDRFRQADVLDVAADLAALEIIEEGQGVLIANRYPWDARLSDMVEGDEVAGAADGDLGKMQLALFTILAIGAYCGAVFQAFAGMNGPDDALPGELLAILTGSQGAYVGTKIPTRTPEA